jgi:hypothetical protein
MTEMTAAARVSRWSRIWRGAPCFVMAAAFGAVRFSLPVLSHAAPQGSLPSLSLKQIPSSLYNISARLYANPVPEPQRGGGSLVTFQSGYLLATGEGILYRIEENEARNALAVSASPITVPINFDAFRRGVTNPSVNLDWFRVTGIAVEQSGPTAILYAVHHFWHEGTKCFALRVSSIELSELWPARASSDPKWTLVYETTPCLPIKTRSDPFAGHQAGGRVLVLSTQTLALSVGDHGFDGVNADQSYPQDPTASYGKIMLIDVKSHTSRMLSLGHRNPQGLFADRTGSLWETEHGPQGGDELNHIHAGRNYGWPLVTYGVNYDTHEWPPNPVQGRHDGYEQPIFSWVPSIGISNVIRVEHDRFSRWRGDLVVASLDGLALWRVRLDGERAVVTEPIPVGIAVRDLVENGRGEIVLWSDRTDHLAFLEPKAGDPLAR